jgi:pyruvate,water dikinase
MPAMSLRILPLTDIPPDQPVGGKAAGLARLITLGLPVPPGFVIIGATPGEGSDRAASAAPSLPSDIAAAYRGLGSPPVAVRSSAIGEDSADASFAGQYATILDVQGESALREAIDACLASPFSTRATAYQAERATDDDGSGATAPPAMSVVVQTMVQPRAAGVLFTADPVTHRRRRIVIDAVAGLGDALVSGHATPDHYVLDRVSGETLSHSLVGDLPLLSDAARRALLEGALCAEAGEGAPLDLEWAIDAEGEIFWLQARPVTTLGADPNELDTPLLDPTHVFTRCNIGEMFPGACTPLSFSFTARAIDIGIQMMHRQVGIQSEIVPHDKFVAMSHGHLFLDLSMMSETATHALGSSAQQMALSLCGRPITEFEIESPTPPPPLLRRVANGLRYLRYLLGQRRARRDMAALVAGAPFREDVGAAELWRAIDERLEDIHLAMHHHLTSSAGSGVLTPALLGVLARGKTPTDAHHAALAVLLAGAEDVESADIVTGVERIRAQVLAHSDGRARFVDTDPESALAWIQSKEAGEAGREFARYLARHGHRAVKELELRQPEWREDPMPLVRSIQVSLRLRDETPAEPAASTRHRSKEAATDPLADHNAAIRTLARMARQAVRSREETKSGLVHVTTRFKRGYRRLGTLLVSEGLLPDPDAVFFLTHQELGRLAGTAETEAEPECEIAALAVARRDVFSYQQGLYFPDVFQGAPEPVSLEAECSPGATSVTGASVSRGHAVGTARIVTRLEEAEALQRGEILVAPITDVGWTPYFSTISGLVTDVGSAVSHGAVVAREYGLPAVVNTRVGTRVFKTGDRIVLDAEMGVVRLAEDDE